MERIGEDWRGFGDFFHVTPSLRHSGSCLVFALAKNIGTDAHVGAALLDGQKAVVAHAPGADGELGVVGEVAVARCLEAGVGGVELAPYLLAVVGEGGHRHHTAQLHVGEVAPLARFKQGEAFLGSKSRLGGFGCHVEFEQAGDDAAATLALAVDFAQEFDAVHRVDERNKWGDVFHLVALEVAYEVPLNVGEVGQLFALLHEFLHAALAKHALPSGVCFADGSRWMVFGNGHQRDALG